MIKIVHIIGRLDYGGAEILLLDICRKIDKSKFSVSVVVLEDQGPLTEQFQNAGIELEFFYKKGKFDFSLVKRLAAYLQKKKPDIVHTHLFAADFWGGCAARKAGVKCLISTKHDILSEGYWRNRLGKKARQRCQKVIAISSATQEFLIKEEQIPLEKIVVIYNGVDVSKFYVKDPQILSGEKLVIGSVGRLSKEKGHKHLIRACRFLKAASWKLLLVGDGPLKKELIGLIRFLGLEDKVKLTGITEDVRPHLKEMDIFVLPSVSEGLSLAVLEAALAGKFVIATAVGGVPEVIKDDETGLLFKPKNIEQLVRHLNWVVEHKEEAVVMVKKLQKFVLEKFDINKIIKEYEKLYLNCTGKKES